MEREILFRGFCPNKNGKQIITLDSEDIRGNWVYGDLIHNIDCLKVRERETDINRIAKSYITIEETVGQFTGSTDKNGKKIFEGDIVSYPCGAEYEVFYDSETMSFRLKNETDIHCFEIDTNLDMKVIGTIFDKEEK